MTRWIAVLLAVVGVSGSAEVLAQDAAPGPSTVVITIIPGGATFFTEAEDNAQAPSFGNYDLGGGRRGELQSLRRRRRRIQRRARHLADDAVRRASSSMNGRLTC